MLAGDAAPGDLGLARSSRAMSTQLSSFVRAEFLADPKIRYRRRPVASCPFAGPFADSSRSAAFAAPPCPAASKCPSRSAGGPTDRCDAELWRQSTAVHRRRQWHGATAHRLNCYQPYRRPPWAAAANCRSGNGVCACDIAAPRGQNQAASEDRQNGVHFLILPDLPKNRIVGRRPTLTSPCSRRPRRR